MKNLNVQTAIEFAKSSKTGFIMNAKQITSLDINTKDATNKLGNSDSGSVQCVFEFNEKIYLLVLQWNDNKGVFLYQLNMDQSILPE